MKSLFLTRGVVSISGNIQMQDFEIAELFGVMIPTIRSHVRAILKQVSQQVITPMAQRWFVVTFCRIITGWEGMSKGEIIIYQTADGSTSLDIKLEQETIWLNQKQIAELFGTKRPAITKYLKNIFLSGELEENRVCSILEHTTPHGAMADKMQTTEVKYYNLDVILSVGYRVNSKKCKLIPYLGEQSAERISD